MRRATHALVLLGLAAAACGGEGDGGKETVVYAGSNWFGHAPVWVGDREGIFEEAGFRVEPRAFGGSSDRVSALESGAAQLSSLGETAMLQAMAAGRRGFVWIGSQDIAPGNEGLVAVGVDSVEGLRGKRVALPENSSAHMTVALLLEQAGLDIREDVEVVNALYTTVVDLVRSGDVAAGATWEPHYTHLRQLPGAKVLGTDLDTVFYERYQSMTGPDVVCASAAWVDEDPERAKRLVAAYFRAVAWCKAHPEEVVGVVAEQTGQTREEVAPALANIVWLDGQDQRVVMSDARMFGQAQALSELLVRLGLMKAVPAFRDWTRPELLPR